MAITKTLFTSMGIVDSLAEIGEWLTAYASGLGFTVSTNSSGDIICTDVNGTNFLKFTKNYGAVDVNITLANGQTSGSITGSNAPTWRRGYVCSNGIAMYATGGAEPHHMWVFIGKTESGGLCVVCQSHKINTESSIGLVYADIEKGRSLIWSVQNSAVWGIYPYTSGKASPETSFIPILLDSGYKAQNMFFTPQTQYPITDITTGLETKISDGKDEYIYSGIVAMKG